MVAIERKKLVYQQTETPAVRGQYFIARDTARVAAISATMATLVLVNPVGIMAALPTPKAKYYSSTELPSNIQSVDRTFASGVSIAELTAMLFPVAREMTEAESVKHTAAFLSFFD